MTETAELHIGRKIERIRRLKGMKQETLATQSGITQAAVSKIEQSEKVDEEKLKKIAEALGVSADAIKNFNENALVNVQNNYDNATVNSQVSYNFYPIEKIVELYGRMLEDKSKRIA